MSTVFAGPPYVLDGPLPVPPPHRLTDVATQIPDGGDPHWRNGAAVWGYPCDGPHSIAPCLAGTFADKTIDEDIPLPEFGAFTVYQSIRCTARSIGDETEFRQRLINVFTARESFAVEQQFASGDSQPLNPFLADANAELLNGGAATDAACALALIEDAIGDTGGAGLIHVAPSGAAALASAFLTVEKSGGLYTARGTRIVVGTGYIGAAPAAPPPSGQSWMFATGPVNYYRGNVVLTPGSVSEALDRSNNDVAFLVERDYLVYWDTCLQAAVLIDFCS